MRNFKPPTPSLAIARWGGSFSLRQRTTMTTITHPLACNCKTGWVSSSFFSRQRTPTTTTTSHIGLSSSSASVCTHDNNDNPPPRLQLRDGVGFFILFFKTTNANDDNDEPCRLVVVICLHLHPRQRR